MADVDDVVRTLSAFANDLANLGGGYVVCGASEQRDAHGFPRLVRTGLAANRLGEVEGKVLLRCRDLVFPSLTPIIEELPSDDPRRRLLIFMQPATGAAHTFREGSDGGKFWVRISRETREARNGVPRELLVRKGAQLPCDQRPCAGATVGDIDLLAPRDALQRMKLFADNVGVETYLSADVSESGLA